MKQFFHSGFYSPLMMICLLIISCNSPDTKTTETIATISYDYSGCFASGKSKIVIYKVDTSIMAKLENDSGKLVVKARLSTAQLDTFNMFISNLKQLGQSGFCTTVSHYSVVLQNESINRTANSCEWNGFDKLSECLFKNGYYPVTIQ